MSPFHKTPTIVGTPQQTAVWEALVQHEAHIIVQALAGTGKTFTLIQGLKRLPSSLDTCFCAFNASIAAELKTKVPTHSSACTLHSLGFRALKSAGMKPRVDNSKLWKIIDDLLPRNFPYRGKTGLKKLVGFLKNTLVDPNDEAAINEALFFLELNIPESEPEELAYHAPAVMNACKDETKIIDFDDMIWLPVVLDLQVPKYDLLMVDEAQDLNRCQQELAFRSGDRLCLVGDTHQAIYGFRGADPQSIPTMQKMLEATERGVEVFPLTVTRRCPQAVTRMARRLVPLFECLEEAKVGRVGETDVPTMLAEVQPGHMILCRVNAPLLSLAYRFLQKNVRVKIQGRDIAEGLKALIKRLGKQDVGSMLDARDEWKEQEEIRIIQKYKYGIETKLALLADRAGCLAAISEGLETTKEVEERIEYLFRDDTGREPVILLSSIHRAKGLEAPHVWIIEADLLPHPMAKAAWEQEQEANLAYVAITRALDSLRCVGGTPKYFETTPLEGFNHVDKSSTQVATPTTQGREVSPVRGARGPKPVQNKMPRVS